MSTFLLPNKRLFLPRRFDIAMRGNVSVNTSEVNGVMTTLENPGDQWIIRLEYGRHYTEVERDEQRAFFHRFRGQANVFRCWPLNRPEPRGTMRGTPFTSGITVEGSNTILVVGAAGTTLEKGDYLGVLQNTDTPQLLEVADTTGTGSVLVSLVAPVRRELAGNSAVTLVRPHADFLLIEPPMIPHEPIVSSGFTIDAVEFVK